MARKTIAQILQGFEFELYLPADIDSTRLMAIEENIKNFLAALHSTSKNYPKEKPLPKTSALLYKA